MDARYGAHDGGGDEHGGERQHRPRVGAVLTDHAPTSGSRRYVGKAQVPQSALCCGIRCFRGNAWASWRANARSARRSNRQASSCNARLGLRGRASHLQRGASSEFGPPCVSNPTFAATTVRLFASYPFVERGVVLRREFRICNNRGGSPEFGPPNLAFDFLPHTYPSYEAAFSGKNLDFVRGSALVFIPSGQRGPDLSHELPDESRCRFR